MYRGIVVCDAPDPDAKNGILGEVPRLASENDHPRRQPAGDDGLRRVRCGVWIYPTGVAAAGVAEAAVTVNSLYIPSSKCGLPVFGSGTLHSAR